MPPARWSPACYTSSRITATCISASKPSKRRSIRSAKPISVPEPTSSRAITQRTASHLSPGARRSRRAGYRRLCSDELKAAAEWIAGVYKDRVEPVDAGPAGDTRENRSVFPHPYCALDPAIEQRADDALVDEAIPGLEAPPGH